MDNTFNPCNIDLDDIENFCAAFASEDNQPGQCTDAESREASSDHPRPFSNFTEMVEDNGKRSKTPRLIDELTKDLWSRFDNYPRVIGSTLFSFDRSQDNPIQLLSDKIQLSAWIQGKSGTYIKWATGQTSGFVTKDEFFSRLLQTGKRYSGIAAAPHYPLRNDIFYTHEDLPPATGGHKTFWEFISFFNPADSTNKTILAMFVLAPLFYDGVNDKPMLLVDTIDAQASGKTSVVKMIALLYDEDPISIDLTTLGNDLGNIKKRILSAEGRRKRIVLLDNLVKTLRSPALADFITSNSITGMAPYGKGEESRPNDLTFFGTFNGASVDTDMATRCYTLQIRAVERPDPGWASRLTAFIKKNRLQIFADALDMIKNAKPRARKHSRFGIFDGKILSAVCRNDEEFTAADNALAKASDIANDDMELAREIDARLTSAIKSATGYSAAKAVVIPHSAVDRILSDGTSKSCSSHQLRKLVRSGHLPTISKEFRALPQRTGFPRTAAFLIGLDKSRGNGKINFQYIDFKNESLTVIFKGEMKCPIL